MENTNRILNREEIPEKYKWAIHDLYPTDEAWHDHLATLEEDKQAMSAMAGTLGESGQALYTYLHRMEEVDEKVYRLSNYCMRKADEDTRNATYQAMVGKYRGVQVALNAAISFDVPEIMAISDETLDRFYAEYPQLERYRRYLTNLRRKKAHTLSAEQEQLLAAAGEIAHTPDSIYGMFVNADLKFPDAVDSQGNSHPVSAGTFIRLEESQDRQLRRSAYESVYDTYNAFRNTAAAILNGQNKQQKFFADARHYEDAFHRSLDNTNVPTEVYLNLIEAVHQNADKMHRYIRLRKKLLGLDKMHYYDIYTPLVPEADKLIPYEQAQQTIYEALAPMGDSYRAILKEGFENRWIDVYPNLGKRGGAYSAGAVVHPYVLMNYSGNLNTQFTLAHEMGHAIHSYLSHKHQNPIDSHYVIFVAEVASNCNEALLMEHLLANTTDKRERAYLINHFLDQFRGSVYRQTLFAEFELNIGRLVAEGKTLTADVLCEEYKRLCQLYYGPDIEVDDRIAVEWARIPHFYYNYYVFQYATGYSAAIALSRRILEEGESAVQDYLNFLSGGCSKSPIDLLKGAGVDMSTTEPVNKALELFASLLDELEALLED